MSTFMTGETFSSMLDSPPGGKNGGKLHTGTPISRSSYQSDVSSSHSIRNVAVEMWKFKLNNNKCCTIDVGHVTNTYLTLPNSINSVNLEQCCTKIDLGIRIDSKLTFSLHVADVVAKSKQRLYMIFRAFSTR